MVEDPAVAAKIAAYMEQVKFGSGEKGQRGAVWTELAFDLDQDAVFAEGFFQKIRSLGAELPKNFLAELFPLLSTKQAQKALKKTHYLLTQQGLGPDPLPGKEPSSPTISLKAPETFQPFGFLSDMDPRRQQMIGMLIPMKGIGRLFVLGLIGEEGLESITAFETGKKRAKEVLAELERETDQRFYEADVGHVALVLKEAHDRRSTLSPEEERLYGRIMDLLEEKGAVGRTPVIHSLFGEEKVERPPLPVVEDLESLPELIFFLPPYEVLEGYLAQVKEVQDSPLVLSDWQKKERLVGVVRKAVEESYPKERWGVLQRYLEEAAYLYFLRGEREKARFFYGWARTFGPEGSFPSPADHPLLMWLLDLVLVKEGGEEGPFPPDEEEGNRTPAGIILPDWGKMEEEDGS